MTNTLMYGMARTSPKQNSEFGNIVLLLQGGGALGAYQAGVYQALYEAGLEPNWVAGISIGAINAAIIAGNPPERRVDQLRAFWEAVTIEELHGVPPLISNMLLRSHTEYQVKNFISAWRTVMLGIPGFFLPRLVSPWFEPKGSVAATSYYDTAPLAGMLERLIDFDRLNHNGMRITLGAVNVTSGNFTSFDNEMQTIHPHHVMASGALPPGMPPVRIGDDYFWDGGLISNTPLQWLLENRLKDDSLVFQIDLWSASGEFPQNMAEVLTRQKDIQFSSRTRANTTRFKQEHRLRHAAARLLAKLPESLLDTEEVALLRDYADTKVHNIVHLIYHNRPYEGYSKDFEFSRLSMQAHWQSGYEDTMRTLQHPEIYTRPSDCEGIRTFDFSTGRRAAPPPSSALDHAQEHQEDHGTDGRMQNGGSDAGAERHPEQRKREPGDKRADNADNNITDNAKATTLHQKAGEPTGDKADNKKYQKIL